MITYEAGNVDLRVKMDMVYMCDIGFMVNKNI